MIPLDPGPEHVRELGLCAVQFAERFLAARASAATIDLDLPADLMDRMSASPPECGSDIATLFEYVGEAASKGFDTTGPGYLAFIPGGGLYSAAIADFIACTINRFVASASAAPALTRLEESVVRWMCDLFDFPANSQGILTSGGSMAHLSALVTARHARLGEAAESGTIYASDQTHYSLLKAARVAGFPRGAIRTVRTSSDLRIDLDHLESLMRHDRASGRRPFMVVGNCGTTNTGTVDDLGALATIAERRGVWFHVDAAYGGFFQLTERGRQRLRGIERADSITVDPHKSLFLPYGTGALLVRDGDALRAAHIGAESAAYLSDARSKTGVVSFADYSAELTRDFRGLRVWLPLHLHGVAAFRACLDERLDLASRLYRQLNGVPGLDAPWTPDLSTVAFRASAEHFADADSVTGHMLTAINSSGRVHISSTQVHGRPLLRVCILSHRVRAERVDLLRELVIQSLVSARSAALVARAS